MKRIVILTGAGISKESGIPTFRDAKDGLWRDHKIEDVASPMGFMKYPGMVLDFYNERRKKAEECKPNQGHLDLVQLEDYYDVQIITQNIDNLHEQAGSTNICHIHGCINQAKTNMSPDKIYEIGFDDINEGDLGDDGYQLRPNVVWFGESVTELPNAERIARSADVFVIIGTSLKVFPAAGLVMLAPKDAPIYFIDPNKPDNMMYGDRITFFQEPATTGVAKMVGELMEKALTE